MKTQLQDVLADCKPGVFTDGCCIRPSVGAPDLKEALLPDNSPS
jgi:hypothetical protein